jgi:hypothetical protein
MYSQGPGDLLGKMLRIDVNTPDGVGYKVPDDNPFGHAYQDRMMALFGITEEGFSKIHMGARPEIWAYGLRNPYSFRFDRKNGGLFIPTPKPSRLGDEVFMLLTLMDEKDKLPVAGRIVWAWVLTIPAAGAIGMGMEMLLRSLGSSRDEAAPTSV